MGAWRKPKESCREVRPTRLADDSDRCTMQWNARCIDESSHLFRSSAPRLGGLFCS